LTSITDGFATKIGAQMEAHFWCCESVTLKSPLAISGSHSPPDVQKFMYGVAAVCTNSFITVLRVVLLWHMPVPDVCTVTAAAEMDIMLFCTPKLSSRW
jgi:hypothetical protein